MEMKTNYDPNNGERIEGKAIHSVLSAARDRYGENYLVRNVQTYDNPHWVAEYNGTTKGNAGIHDDMRSLSPDGAALM
ncbi:hypothetical protein P4V74_07880 [Bacillus thuringiensis]|nr:hypothetical protein [Bacillus thuringiensis]